MGNDRDTVLSVKLLTSKGAAVTVNTLDNNATLATEFSTAYPQQKKLPYIVIDNVAVGGFKELTADANYSMKAPPKAAAPVVKPTKFGKGSGITPIAQGAKIVNSIAAPKIVNSIAAPKKK
jgi:hypothetical protein